MSTLLSTDFRFDGQTSVYHGKVRDVYTINDAILAIVATDRISAFDVVLPEGIPCKGQILNQIAAYFLDATRDIVPNWKLAVPDPMATVGIRAQAIPVEVIVRGYLAGSAWRAYEAGERSLCGVTLPEGMVENQKFPTPIITPTTKAAEGHDENISAKELVDRGIVDANVWAEIERVALQLFNRGSQMAAEKGLLLVDTKYEFGLHDGKLMLIDEIHTPDSSRYFYAEGYQQRLEAGEPQRQLSKEFVRQWLMDNGFSGKEGQTVPEMTPEFVNSVTERYIELYEHITGQTFERHDSGDLNRRVGENLIDCLSNISL